MSDGAEADAPSRRFVADQKSTWPADQKSAYEFVLHSRASAAKSRVCCASTRLHQCPRPMSHENCQVCRLLNRRHAFSATCPSSRVVRHAHTIGCRLSSVRSWLAWCRSCASEPLLVCRRRRLRNRPRCAVRMLESKASPAHLFAISSLSVRPSRNPLNCRPRRKSAGRMATGEWCTCRTCSLQQRRVVSCPLLVYLCRRARTTSRITRHKPQHIALCCFFLACTAGRSPCKMSRPGLLTRLCPRARRSLGHGL